MFSWGSLSRRKEIVKLLRRGFVSAQHIGGILATIITVNPKVKIIVEMRDTGDARTYLKAFQDHPDQRRLVESVLLHAIYREPHGPEAPIIIELHRSRESLSIKVFGLKPDDSKALARKIARTFGSGIVEDTGQLTSFRVVVPRDWKAA